LLATGACVGVVTRGKSRSALNRSRYPWSGNFHVPRSGCSHLMVAPVGTTSSKWMLALSTLPGGELATTNSFTSPRATRLPATQSKASSCFIATRPP
jgi:hypothetical protein